MGDWDWGQAVQGNVGGSMSGAAAGSVAGPWGAVIGGAIGGTFGFFAGGMSGDPKKDYEKRLNDLASGYKDRQAQQVGPAHQAAQSALVGNRGALIAQLEAMARGEGPSAARQMMRDGMDRAVGAQTSAAAGAGGRGVNAGAALRNATGNSAAIMMQGNRDMGVMRAQEQANAIGQLGQNISQGINADNSLNTWNAGQQNQQEQFNAQMMAQQLGLNDDMQLRALLAAASMAPQAMGTSLLAGGATAAPGIAQNLNAQKQQQQGQANFDAEMAYKQQQAQQQQQNYMNSLRQQTPQAPPAPGFMMGNSNNTWNQ